MQNTYKYTAYAGQSIVDVCINQYADIEQLFGLLQSLAAPAEATFATGQTVVLQTAQARDINRITVRQQVLSQARQSQTIIYAGQNLPDLALQEYGSIEGLFDLMAENSLSADQLFVPGRTLKVLPGKVRKDVVDYYQRLSYRVNTGAEITDEAGEFEYSKEFATDFNASDE